MEKSRSNEIANLFFFANAGHCLIDIILFLFLICGRGYHSMFMGNVCFHPEYLDYHK